jgi:hypothetical protein
MTDKVLTLKYSKSTKGTHVYTDASPEAPIPSVYIKRAALPASPPQTITLTLGIHDGE